MQNRSTFTLHVSYWQLRAWLRWPYMYLLMLVGCNEWKAAKENETKSICLHSKSSVECLRIIYFCFRTLMQWNNQKMTCSVIQSITAMSPSSNVTARPRNLFFFFFNVSGSRQQSLTLLSMVSNKEKCSPLVLKWSLIDTRVLPCLWMKRYTSWSRWSSSAVCVCHPCKLQPESSGTFRKYYPPTRAFLGGEKAL